MAEQSIHATTVAFQGAAVLLLGSPGAGKSDLALRLIDRGWSLVSDDQTLLTWQGERLIAQAPEPIAGQIEMRGLGIVRQRYEGEAEVVLAIDLRPGEELERMPEPARWTFQEGNLPLLLLDPREASAPLKVEWALQEQRDKEPMVDAMAVPPAEPGESPPDADKRVVLVTGLSGAGHSTALRILEDRGFEAIDNLPLPLLESALLTSGARPLALGIDVRSRQFEVGALLEAIRALREESGCECRLVFLDCDDDTLGRRFSETRRRHPLAEGRPITDGIAAERRLVAPLKEAADLVIDTSKLSPSRLEQLLAGDLHFGAASGMDLFVLSFSYRQGLPREADLVLDARFLTNPHHEPSLRHLTGEDEAVAAFIQKDRAFQAFEEKIKSLLTDLLPGYEAQGKRYLTIAVGCTGGRHRSVLVAGQLAAWLRESGRGVILQHRDLPKSE